MAVDEVQFARMAAELEDMLRAFNARPDRCCHRSCLRCPERSWRLSDALPLTPD
jgi:hypothetical protein